MHSTIYHYVTLVPIPCYEEDRGGHQTYLGIFDVEIYINVPIKDGNGLKIKKVLYKTLRIDSRTLDDDIHLKIYVVLD